MSIIFTLVLGVLGSMPYVPELPSWVGSAVRLISSGLAFFPTDVWVVTIANIVFWLDAHLVWACVEWVYKKIPGVE
ncbi:MAG: hypothetical protein PHR41_09365 [Lactococcus chungangensis]|nr:hypothetical protein [Lactococcus chungangensis]